MRTLRAVRSVTTPASAGDLLFDRVAAAARERIRSDRALRRNLPEKGRLSLDRALPFLAVYRRPPGSSDAGSADLVTALASYLHAPGEERHLGGVRELVHAIVD